WTVTGTLDPGVYYAACDIRVQTSARATFVAEGTVELAADGAQVEAYADALAFLSGATADDAVLVTAGEAEVYGYLAAPAGGVQVAGELLRVTCGIVADHADL